MTAPLIFTDLTSDALRADRTRAEIAYLAHVLLDETLASRYTRPRLSPKAHELLELLDDLAATCRLMSLGWTADVEGCSDDAVRLAIRVDRVTAGELANVGPFAHVAAALEIRLRSKAQRTRFVDIHLKHANHAKHARHAVADVA